MAGETNKAARRGKAARRLARERVGAVPAARLIAPKTRRKKPKHKARPIDELEA
jgi:hypothetical protein